MITTITSNMKIATVSKKWIKPRIPTPPTRQTYYLSLIDQNMPSNDIGVILFYQSKPENPRQLEESLAEILVEFYPLAGRYTKNDRFIDCSDQGAMFVEAEALDVELTMDQVKNMEIHHLNNLFPYQDSAVDAPTPLLSIQVTHFPFGGLAIAISISHKVFDAASRGMFLAAWSNAANPKGEMAFSPSLDLPSMLPLKDYDGKTIENRLLQRGGTIVVKKFFFDKEALTRLRSKLSPNQSGKTISRVRVVCAVIAEALTRLDRSKHGKTRDLMIYQAVNMRGRTITPSPKHACGNLVAWSLTPLVAASEGEEIGMQELVDLMGDAVVKTIADHAEMLSPNVDGRDVITTTRGKLMQQMSNPDTNVIGFSDWSKFGFYEADFGSGKPVWVSFKPLPITNVTYLMSNKDGDGIEAWVYLNQDDIHYLEQDEEISAFTT